MSLDGTFDTLPVTELLGLLARSRKTGVLDLETPELEGRLWLLDGRCRAVELGDTSGPAATPGDLQERLVDVCLEVARVGAGSFRFVDGVEPPWPTAYDLAVDDALAEAGRLLDEWDEILRAIPSFEAHPQLSADLACPSMTVDAAQWKILATLDGTRCVNEVVSGSQRSVIAVCSVLREMTDRGAVEMLAPVGEASGATCDLAAGAGPESSLAGVLEELAELSKGRHDEGFEAPTRDPIEAEAAGLAELAMSAEDVPGECVPDGDPVTQPVAPDGPGAGPLPTRSGPVEGDEGVTRDRGAMLRLFSAIRDL